MDTIMIFLAERDVVGNGEEIEDDAWFMAELERGLVDN